MRVKQSRPRLANIHLAKHNTGMDMLEANKTKHVVVPALGFPCNILDIGEQFGYPRSKAEEVGYQRELDTAVLALREMHRRGIVVLPGG